MSVLGSDQPRHGEKMNIRASWNLDAHRYKKLLRMCVPTPPNTTAAHLHQVAEEPASPVLPEVRVVHMCGSAKGRTQKAAALPILADP